MSDAEFIFSSRVESNEKSEAAAAAAEVEKVRISPRENEHCFLFIRSHDLKVRSKVDTLVRGDRTGLSTFCQP